MTQEENNKINSILSKVFLKIKNGDIERAWDVYDEFKKQLGEL